MGTVNGFTAEHMESIIQDNIIAGAVDLGTGHLMLETRDGTPIDAGLVVGPTGETGPAGAGVPLAYKEYDPAGGVSKVNTANNIWEDLDAVNLSLVVPSAPASGRIAIDLFGEASNTGGGIFAWGVREGTTIVGKPCRATTGINAGIYTVVRVIITGLVAGSSHTYKWAQRSTSFAATGVRMGGGEAPTGYGAAIMTAIALP